MNERSTPRHRFRPGAGMVLCAIATTPFAGTFTSCGHRSEEVHRIIIDTSSSLTFDVGFPIHPFQCGMLEDASTGERTFYFANTNTGRMLKRFDVGGRMVGSVPLASAIDSLGTVQSLLMLRPDSILLFTPHGLSMALINGEGTVQAVYDLQDGLHDSLGYTYHLEPTVMGRSVLPQALLFEARCHGHLTDTIDNTSLHARLQGFYARQGRAAHMALLRFDTTGPHIAFGQYGYYNGSCAQGDTSARDWTEGLGYSCIGEVIYHYSVYTPWVQRLNDQLTVLDSFLVRSDHGPCHITLPVLTEVESLHMQDSTNKRLRTRNYITTVSPCPPLACTFVAIHIADVGSDGQQPNWEPEWTWVIHDTSGTRLGERRFDSSTYDGWCVLWNKDRAWVKRASTPQERREGLLHFDRLTLLR